MNSGVQWAVVQKIDVKNTLDDNEYMPISEIEAHNIIKTFIQEDKPVIDIYKLDSNNGIGNTNNFSNGALIEYTSKSYKSDHYYKVTIICAVPMTPIQIA